MNELDINVFLPKADADAAAYLHYGIELLGFGLAKYPTMRVARQDPDLYMKMRAYFPYRIEAVSAKAAYLLNRDYSRLGTNGYCIARSRPLRIAINTEEIALLSVKVKGAVRIGTLFYDGAPPWQGRKEATDYLEKLDYLYAWSL